MTSERAQRLAFIATVVLLSCAHKADEPPPGSSGAASSEPPAFAAPAADPRPVPPEVQKHLAALKASLAASEQDLRTYQWVETGST